MAEQGLPDFFLIGAQKAGTTTLAWMLDDLPGVTLSRPKEPMLFCFDDAKVHRNEVLHPDSRWPQFNWERDREGLLARYRGCFAHAAEGDLLGDASTSYALSEKAVERIAATVPKARIVMVLRDPLKRAVSAYWHGVRKGLVTGSFEEEVRYGGVGLMEFGFYEEQLRRYQARFGRGNLHVLHFEDLVVDPEPCLRRLLEFLGLPPAGAEILSLNRLNVSYYPRVPFLHRLIASWMRRFTELSGASSLLLEAGPDASIGEAGRASRGGWRGLYRRLAMTDRPPPAINETAAERLRELFRRENAGLGELLGEDVFARWGWE